eukprot:TRINITY_DN1427_c0_g1_i1.p1 TRINITY_DN1427_c0_g1~~TRINITY_DN1427_c0_g1_i1.p1  ORF type:complete len:222 (-),score=23.00 TRINITY_DN1427_c0_g1_i1:27-692(-)
MVGIWDLEPDIVTYTALIEHSGKHKDWEEAVRLHSLMMKKGIQPTEFSYLAFIQAMGRSGQPEKALKIFHDTIAMSFKPVLSMFNVVLEAVAETGDYKKAIQLLWEMKRCKLQPDNTSILSVIKACNIGNLPWHFENISTLLSVLKKVGYLFPNIKVYNALAISMSQQGEWEQAKVLLSTMKSAGLRPDNNAHHASKTYMAIIRLCSLKDIFQDKPFWPLV